MNYQYLDSNNETAGPATLDEIRSLARDGKIPSNPQVRPLGSDNWSPLSDLSQDNPAPQGTPAKVPLPISGTYLADWVVKLLSLIRSILSPKLIQTSLSMAKYFGQYAVLLGGALGFIAAIVAAIRYNSFGIFLAGLGFLIALAIAQFAASQFLDASDKLIENTPSRVSSLAFLDCVGLLAVLGAVVQLLGGIVMTIQTSSAPPLVLAIVFSALWTCFGTIALHPKLAFVDSGSGSAGEEAIGILAFFLKATLKLVPLLFALLAGIGALVLLVGIFAPQSQFVRFLTTIVPTLPVPGLGGPGLAGLGVVLTATLLPLIAYFLFLVASLPLELWRAVLSLPGKLDKLRQ